MAKQTGTGERSADIDLGFLDLNTASERELAQIPWIGEACAKELAARRPFASMNDVRKVPGVTDDIIDQLVRGGATIGLAGPRKKAA